MGLFRGRPASLARLGAAALTVITAVAVLRAGQAVQTPPPGQQAPPATQQAPPAGQQQPAQQQPVFRAGVKLVRVDVTVTGKGDLPVADLTPADFEVAEDGAPQKVEQLQFVRLDGQRPAGDETSLEIRFSGSGRGRSRPRRRARVRDLLRRLPRRQGAADHDPDAPGPHALRQPPVALGPGRDHGPPHDAERPALHALEDRSCRRP